MPPIVTLMTDFGNGSYVAQIKGVLLGYRPDVVLVDADHQIAPQDVRGGAIVLADFSPRFPPGTMHLAVVDPGVGTGRRILLAEIGDWTYLLPDNGLVSLVAARWPVRRFIELNRSQFWAPNVAPTFHGRDIMAHVIGHRLRGIEPTELGEPTDRWVSFEWGAKWSSDHRLVGEIIAIDRFGNAITNLRRSDLGHLAGGRQAMTMTCEVAVGGRFRPVHWGETYGQHEVGTLVAIFDSQDRLELAVVNGNAAHEYRLAIGDEVEVIV